MFNSRHQPDPHDEHHAHDPLEQLIEDAARQYKSLRYPQSRLSVQASIPEPSRLFDRWQWLGAAAVLVLAVAIVVIWSPAEQAGRTAEQLAHWQPETRQASPHAALAAARTVLAKGTIYPTSMSPESPGFRFPEAPRKTTGFAVDSQHSG